jgi:hypothetical protein
MENLCVFNGEDPLLTKTEVGVDGVLNMHCRISERQRANPGL